MAAICNRILLDLKIGRTARLSREKRTDAVNTALERLCRKLDLTPGERIGYGDFTIVWSGRMQGRGVAIKVLAESPFRERSPAFEDRVRRVRGLEDPCFLKLRHSDLDEEPHALVMDHTEAPTLAQHLQSKGKFHPGLMARLIQRLVVALEEYHRCGLRYGALSPENVFYDEAASPHPMLRLSAVGVSSHLSQFHETAGEGWFPRDAGEATYLVPEQYEGQPYTDKSDQYGVGLLAFEMLEGRPPVTVSRLADLEKKRQFFDDPARFAGEWPRVYSHLRDVVFRMLRRDPADRFPGLGEVHRALAHLEPADVALAKKSYSRVCAARPEFYAEFYRRFFARCPEARALFGNLEQQYVQARLGPALPPELRRPGHDGADRADHGRPEPRAPARDRGAVRPLRRGAPGDPARAGRGRAGPRSLAEDDPARVPLHEAPLGRGQARAAALTGPAVSVSNRESRRPEARSAVPPRRIRPSAGASHAVRRTADE